MLLQESQTGNHCKWQLLWIKMCSFTPIELCICTCFGWTGRCKVIRSICVFKIYEYFEMIIITTIGYNDEDTPIKWWKLRVCHSKWGQPNCKFNAIHILNDTLPPWPFRPCHLTWLICTSWTAHERTHNHKRHIQFCSTHLALSKNRFSFCSSQSEITNLLWMEWEHSMWVGVYVNVPKYKPIINCRCNQCAEIEPHSNMAKAYAAMCVWLHFISHKSHFGRTFRWFKLWCGANSTWTIAGAKRIYL